jgi:drug/metabolite transporter (DMT)-like permease
MNRARLQVLAAALLFSTGGAAIKVAAFSAAEVSMLRSGIAALAMLILLRGRVRWRPITALIGGVYAATLTLFVISTKLTTSANAIFLQSTAPLYLLVLGPLFLHERTHRRDIAYVAASAVGMVCCFLGQRDPTLTAPNPVLGNVLAVGCGIVWALTLLALRWAERHHERSGLGLSAVVAGNAMACLIALPFALPLPDAPPSAWATVVFLGVFQIALAYVALTAAMRHLPALDVSLLLLLEPALNPLWTWLVRGERPAAWTLVGGAAILLAAGAKSVSDARLSPVALAPSTTTAGGSPLNSQADAPLTYRPPPPTR